MIALSRLNGSRFALNSDLIERIDASPDTVITLVDGTKYLVAESIDDVIDGVRAFRASIIASSGLDPVHTIQQQPPLRVVARSEDL
ncbi:MAG TPA: flagellar FlbD family protein [Acidimicrobiales bacterium]